MTILVTQFRDTHEIFNLSHLFTHRELTFVHVESCPLLGGCLSMCITCMKIRSVPGGLSVVENCPLFGVSVSGDSAADVQN